MLDEPVFDRSGLTRFEGFLRNMRRDSLTPKGSALVELAFPGFLGLVHRPTPSAPDSAVETVPPREHARQRNRREYDPVVLALHHAGIEAGAALRALSIKVENLWLVKKVRAAAKLTAPVR